MVEPKDQKALMEDKSIPSKPTIIMREAEEKGTANLSQYKDDKFNTADIIDMEFRDELEKRK